MPLPLPIPPWLSVNPSDFVAASQGGLNAGIAAARTWQAGLEESARLGQQQRLADLAAKVKEEDSQRNFILEQQKDMSDAEYRRAALAQRKSEVDQQAETDQMKAQAAIENYQRLQQIGILRAQAEQAKAMQPKYFNVRPGGSVVGVGPEGGASEVFSKAPLPPKKDAYSDAMNSLLSGSNAAPSVSAAVKGKSPPFAEGDRIRSKDDGKIYIVKGGLPVLVDDTASQDEETDTEE